MNKEEAQQYIHQRIPITKQMGMVVHAIEAQDVRVGLPIQPNMNHHGSAFGGSIESLFFVTGWAFIQKITEHINPEPLIVGRRGKVSFNNAIREDFVAQLIIPPHEEIERFVVELQEEGKSRITAQAFIEIDGVKCADFEGDFVVLTSK